MKILVETTGAFMLVDPETRDVLDSQRPSVASKSNFLTARAAAGQVRTLSNELTDEATDAEFEKFWRESVDAPDGRSLAIASFLAVYAAPGMQLPLLTEPTPAKSTRTAKSAK